MQTGNVSWSLAAPRVLSGVERSQCPLHRRVPSPNPAPGEGAACCCQVKKLSVPLLLDVMGDRGIEDNAFFLYLVGRHTGKCVRAPSSVRVWIFLRSITVLNLSHSCSEPPWDCLHFSFRTASLKAARRGEAVTQPRVPCPLAPAHQSRLSLAPSWVWCQ